MNTNQSPLPDSFDVTITPEDFRDATEYIDSQYCPLSVALKGKFPGSFVSTGPFKSTVDNVWYAIPEKQWGPVDSPYSGKHIDELIAKAKDSLEDIPTVTLTLTKVK
jgi:hypothetical protein